MEFKDAKDLKDIKEMLEKIEQLQQQIHSPNREGMIKALSEAQKKAPVEIGLLEFAQGDIYRMPWAGFSDADLYRKLSQYKQGLENACIAKIGKEAYDELTENK